MVVPLAYPGAYQLGEALGEGILSGAKATAGGVMQALGLVLMPTPAEAPGSQVSDQTAKPPSVWMANDNDDKTADEMLPGSLKRSPSYYPPYGNLIRKDLLEKAKKGDQKAGKMKKLDDQLNVYLKRIKERNDGKYYTDNFFNSIYTK